jgi:FkbM family methyltransferase
MSRFIYLLNSLLSNLGLSLVRNSSRSDLPSLIRRLQNHGIEIKVVYDIGAYKGLWTSALSKQLEKNTKFFMFEPNEAHNDSLAGVGHPFFNVLLSDKSETKQFFSLEGSGDSYYPEMPGNLLQPVVKKIKSTTLDSLVLSHENPLPMPDLIKIDTQGSELDVLRGAKEVLKSTSVIIMECPILKYNQGAPHIQDYLDFALKNGWVPFAVVEIHTLRDVFVQVDIAFVSEDIFREKIGDLSDMGFWKSTEDFYKSGKF